MNGLLYDIDKTYEQNWQDGPPVFLKKIQPQKRTAKKKYRFLEFDVNLPFGIPAGPLLNSKYIQAAFDFGFDVSTYKTVRSCPVKANQYPHVLFVDIDGDYLTLEKAEKPLVGKTKSSKPKEQFSITNSFGNPSLDPQIWQEDMKKAVACTKKGQLMIASVVGTIQKGFSDLDYYKDFAKTANLAKETGAKVIEVNLSCPNVASEGVLCYTKEAVEKICKYTKESIGNIPLLAKIGYYSIEQQQLLDTIIKNIAPYVSGIAAINTISATVVDKNGKQALPGEGRLKSGVCGKAIKWAGLDMVKRLNKLREKLNIDFAIIGVGGVMTPKDYFEYRKAGADLVQSATGAMWNPNLAFEIWQREQ